MINNHANHFPLNADAKFVQTWTRYTVSKKHVLDGKTEKEFLFRTEEYTPSVNTEKIKSELKEKFPEDGYCVQESKWDEYVTMAQV